MMQRGLTRLELSMSDIENANKEIENKIAELNDGDNIRTSNNTTPRAVPDKEAERRIDIRLRIGFGTPK